MHTLITIYPAFRYGIYKSLWACAFFRFPKRRKIHRGTANPRLYIKNWLPAHLLMSVSLVSWALSALPNDNRQGGLYQSRNRFIKEHERRQFCLKILQMFLIFEIQNNNIKISIRINKILNDNVTKNLK